MLRRALAAALWLASTVTLVGSCVIESRSTCGGDDCGYGECCIRGCGGVDPWESCVDSMGACPEIHAPVCGCDGLTYGNACSAHDACVAIASEGPCAVCIYGPQSYVPGQTFPSEDGCAECTCDAQGGVLCQVVGCSVGCEHGGLLVPPGDSVEAGDGCNTCTCVAGGFACTEKACACDPTLEFGRDYVGSSVEQCMLIDFTCPSNTVGFSNGCGCGCEQAPWCPQYFDCMPGPDHGCETSELAELCPYSGFAL